VFQRHVRIRMAHVSLCGLWVFRLRAK
jgi:hypothetical protein